MSKVTPIRPGMEPPSGTADGNINVVDQRLAQARAIVDLVMTSDPEDLFDDTINNALWAVLDHIEAARQEADKVHRASRERRNESG